MVVTLDQLRPYDHDPRMKRNPAYEEIKASIRERGLDAAPAITRRPGEAHYIIRNGGNTRLAILREFWSGDQGRTLLPHMRVCSAHGRSAVKSSR
jgi:ParB family protein of integrating conjugative element (PFGI_1 class)